MERKNVMGKIEYIDTSTNDIIFKKSQFVKKIKKGEIIDTLYASMTLVKSDNGWQ